MKEVELKPCPFCGSAKLKIDKKSTLYGYNGLDMRAERHTYSYVGELTFSGGKYAGIYFK